MELDASAISYYQPPASQFHAVQFTVSRHESTLILSFHLNVSLTSRPFPIAFSKKNCVSYLFTNDERLFNPALPFKLPGQPYYAVPLNVKLATGSLHHLYLTRKVFKAKQILNFKRSS